MGTGKWEGGQVDDEINMVHTGTDRLHKCTDRVHTGTDRVHTDADNVHMDIDRVHRDTDRVHWYRQGAYGYRAHLGPCDIHFASLSFAFELSPTPQHPCHTSMLCYNRYNQGTYIEREDTGTNCVYRSG